MRVLVQTDHPIFSLRTVLNDFEILSEYSTACSSTSGNICLNQCFKLILNQYCSKSNFVHGQKNTT